MRHTEASCPVGEVARLSKCFPGPGTDRSLPSTYICLKDVLPQERGQEVSVACLQRRSWKKLPAGTATMTAQQNGLSLYFAEPGRSWQKSMADQRCLQKKPCCTKYLQNPAALRISAGLTSRRRSHDAISILAFVGPYFLPSRCPWTVLYLHAFALLVMLSDSLHKQFWPNELVDNNRSLCNLAAGVVRGFVG